MECSRCHRRLTEDETYVHQGKAFCDDCLMDIGLSAGQCDPWATYVDKRTRARQRTKGSEGLTDAEVAVYELVRSRCRVTRAEVMADLGLSETELRLQLLPLLHADLVKERAESGKLYLVAID